MILKFPINLANLTHSTQNIVQSKTQEEEIMIEDNDGEKEGISQDVQKCEENAIRSI